MLLKQRDKCLIDMGYRVGEYLFCEENIYFGDMG
jgi:hypothetical protein